MVTIYLYTFASIVLVSFISLVGVFTLSLKEETMKKNIFVFISIAVGALLGDSFIHLIPESFESSINKTLIGILIILGILVFFTLEKVMHWHHHGEDTDNHSIHPVGKMVLVSDGVHNFLDGIIVAASFSINIPLGIATTLAVILHEIPQEIGDFAVLIHSGYTKSRALWLNFLSALTAVLGSITFFILGNLTETLSDFLLPITAGGFIYIAVADLIPELHKTKEEKHTLLQLVSVILGVLVMITLLFLE